MQTLLPSSRIKVILVSLLVLLAVASFFYNQFLIKEILDQERASVELWAKALEFTNDPVHEKVTSDLLTAAQVLRTIEEVPDSVVQLVEGAEALQPTLQFVTDELVLGAEHNIPTIVTDETGFMTVYRFIDDDDVHPGLVEKFAAVNEPISITFGVEGMQQQQFIYFGESQTVQYLRYFPYIQFGILALLIGVGYITYRSITRSEQSNLWVGMAKEAAHQLGTPLSSLYGWVQLLKEKYKDNDEALSIVYEIDNDLSRIKDVAERFNKIGSKPELKKVRIEPIVDQVIEYMKKRLPQIGKNIQVNKSIESNSKVMLNAELFQWAIENLIKNAMDAIREANADAFISIKVYEQGNHLIIDVEDSGTGIERKYLKEIFKPGYSTKKRGWGLGLSLTRRIIETYHGGKIFVHKTELYTGSTFRIQLPLEK